jgi:hypothetical protein
VWLPLIGWLACALTRDAPGPLRLPIAALVCAFFVYGDLPVFLLGATAAWFHGAP